MIVFLFSTTLVLAEEFIIHTELTPEQKQAEETYVEERNERLSQWAKEITQRNHALELEKIKYQVLLEAKLLVAKQSRPNINIAVFNDSYSKTKTTTTSEATAKSKSKSSSSASSGGKTFTDDGDGLKEVNKSKSTVDFDFDQWYGEQKTKSWES